jgi:hypothetical protein
MNDPRLPAIHRDDKTLDRLGRAEPARDGDEVEAMLAAWRRTLPAPGAPDPALIAAITRTPQKRRLARASVGVAASVALLSTGGVLVGAAYASPGSTLWPVTRFVYGGLAESRQALDGANQALSDARAAAARHHYAEAMRLLATADALADKVDEAAAAERLRGDIAKVREQLSGGAHRPPRTPDASGTGELGVDPPSLDPGSAGQLPPGHDNGHRGDSAHPWGPGDFGDHGDSEHHGDHEDRDAPVPEVGPPDHDRGRHNGNTPPHKGVPPQHIEAPTQTPTQTPTQAPVEPPSGTPLP